MNRPVLIGVGCIQQKDIYSKLDEALILMDKAVNEAIKDTTNREIINYIDEIQIPKGFWRYRDPGRWIAKKNNMNSLETKVSKIGILQQNLINEACNRIKNGEINGSLIVGGESRYKLQRACIENKKYYETKLDINPDKYIKAPNELQLEVEEKELGHMAVGYYAILESAYRANSNLNLDEHNEFLANIYSNYSQIAAKNKDGWIDKPYKKNDIKIESKKNSLQAYPYNKYHCTSWNVNQSCALIICSEKVANFLNVPFEKRVYPLASSETNHMIATLQRPSLVSPEGMRLAADFILKICDKNKIAVNFYDFYSCFPIAVQMFANSLNIKDISQMTVTGGMPFAGGPLNSFVLHSTAKLVSEIRKKDDACGIVTGVSGMMTKQSYALWSKKPRINFTYKDFTKEARKKEKPINLSNNKNGKGQIIGYTIMKKNNKLKAIMFIHTSDNKRKLITSTDCNIIQSMQAEEWVGKNISFKENQLI